MTTVRHFNFSDDKKISAISIQPSSNYLWLSYEINSDDFCLVKKVWAFQPDQIFFELEREVEEIKCSISDTTQVYFGYDDSDLIGEILNTSNPLVGNIEINIPVGIIEAPVDVQVNGTDLFYLTPGIASGENAKLVRFNTDGDYQETIDLNTSAITIVNASTFTIDENDDIWVITNDSPSSLIRVFQLSGGIWDFEETVLS